MNQPDNLQLFWDRACQIVNDAAGPAVKKPPEKPAERAPTAEEQLFFELWRFEHYTQRKIAFRYNVSQPTVSRACRRVLDWLGTASDEEVGELPAEQKFRAMVRIHERTVRNTERRLMRDYRRSSRPQVTRQTRVHHPADEATGKPERWVVTIRRSQKRDPRYLDRIVRHSRDEVTLSARRFPQRMHRDRRFPREENLARLQADVKACQELLEEVALLHKEYVHRLATHQQIYGYMDKWSLKRDCAPSIPLGGWVKQRDFSARRDQPGVFTYDDADNQITAESVYGPAELWQPGTPEWFDRKRREERQEAAGQPLQPPPPVPGVNPAGESLGESLGPGESPETCEKLRENRCESPPRAACASESKCESPRGTNPSATAGGAQQISPGGPRAGLGWEDGQEDQ